MKILDGKTLSRTVLFDMVSAQLLKMVLEHFKTKWTKKITKYQ